MHQQINLGIRRTVDIVIVARIVENIEDYLEMRRIATRNVLDKVRI